jgi:outer membrane protein
MDKSLRPFIFFVIGFLLLFSASSLYAENLKIGIFDIQKIMKESKVVQGYRNQMLQEVESKKKILSGKQESTRQIEKRLKDESQTLSSAERKSLEEKLTTEIKELRRMNEDIEAELRKRDSELTRKAFLEIQEIVKKIADKEGYTIVFEKNSAGIVHLKSSVDITSKVINMYDK